jgi:hypothetical protein
VIDEKGPTKDLLEELEDADVAVEAYTLDEYAEACSRFFDKVRAGQLHPQHPSSAELDEAVAGAAWRTVGDRRSGAASPRRTSRCSRPRPSRRTAPRSSAPFNVY